MGGWEKTEAAGKCGHRKQNETTQEEIVTS